MVFSYYPGCTLKTQAKELDALARRSAEALGIVLDEIESWQCCGAVYPLGADEIATKLASVRVLKAAARDGRPLVTLCAACTHVIKRVNDDMRNNEDIRTKVNNYMQEGDDYYGEAEVLHFIEVIDKYIGFDELKKRVKNPLAGRRIGAYYGCMLLRPSSVMAFDDPENPTIFERFIKALGAEPIVYPYRNECCGGYISLKEKERTREMVTQIKENAKQNGAEQLITACPLCLYNLKQTDCGDLSIDYLTEILAEALGILRDNVKEVSYAHSK